MYKRNSNTDKARSIYNKLYTDNCIFRYKQAEYIEVITVVAWLELWKGCAEEFGTTGSQIPEAEDFLPRSSRSGKWSNNDRPEVGSESRLPQGLYIRLAVLISVLRIQIRSDPESGSLVHKHPINKSRDCLELLRV